MTKLQPWVLKVLANPITKKHCKQEDLKSIKGIIDARVYLKNTNGYDTWEFGQEDYISSRSKVHPTITAEDYRHWILQSKPVYDYFKMTGRILDVGGADGIVRQHLPKDIEFVSTDPWIDIITGENDPVRASVYTCLNSPLNFIGATAEFQPFVSEVFDWVHMRSMLDHVQVVDLALLEANRVLKINGKILIGLYVEGGKTGVISSYEKFKEFVKSGFELFGINRWKDHHLFHPTYEVLLKAITDNGFIVEDTFWQPGHNDHICYIAAKKK
tara:strand:+ start:1428 stop:2240 length:813 start_codon:yes stop_codon:yes gene_type:complete